MEFLSAPKSVTQEQRAHQQIQVPSRPSQELLSTPPPPQLLQQQQQQQLIPYTNFSPPRFLQVPSPSIMNGSNNSGSAQASQQSPSVICVASYPPSSYQLGVGGGMEQEQISNQATVSRRRASASVNNSTVSVYQQRGPAAQQSQQLVIIQHGQQKSIESPSGSSSGVGRGGGRGGGGGRKATKNAGGRKTPHANSNSNTNNSNALALVMPPTANSSQQDDEVQIVAEKGRRSRGQRLDSIISNGTEMSTEDLRMHKTRENERKRRMAQKNSAEKLRSLVPGLSDGKARKAGEGIVMQKSAEYIEELLKELQSYREKEEQQKQQQQQRQRQQLALLEAHRQNQRLQFGFPEGRDGRQQHQQFGFGFQEESKRQGQQFEIGSKEGEKPEPRPITPPPPLSPPQKPLEEIKHPFRPDVWEQLHRRSKDYNLYVYQALKTNVGTVVKASQALKSYHIAMLNGIVPTIDTNLLRTIQPDLSQLPDILAGAVRFWVRNEMLVEKEARASAAAAAPPPPGTTTASPGNAVMLRPNAPGLMQQSAAAAVPVRILQQHTTNTGFIPISQAMSTNSRVRQQFLMALEHPGSIRVHPLVHGRVFQQQMFKREIQEGNNYQSHVTIAEMQQQHHHHQQQQQQQQRRTTEEFPQQAHLLGLAEVKREVIDMEEDRQQGQQESIPEMFKMQQQQQGHNLLDLAQVKREVVDVEEDEKEDDIQGAVDISETQQQSQTNEEGTPQQDQLLGLAEVKREIEEVEDDDEEEEEDFSEEEMGEEENQQETEEVMGMRLMDIKTDGEEDETGVTESHSSTGQEEQAGSSSGVGGCLSSLDKLFGWSIQGIGDRVPTDDEDDNKDDDDDMTGGGGACKIEVQNVPGAVVTMSKNTLPQVPEEPKSPSPEPEVNVMMLQVELKNQDKMFREMPLFKEDFIWHSILNDKERIDEVNRTCMEAFKQVQEERIMIDYQLQLEREEQLKAGKDNKRKKKDNDDDWKSGGKKRGRGRGRRR